MVVLYGYRIQGPGRRTIDEGEARIVRSIFELFVAGMSPAAIARRLNADGVPGKQGRPWTDSMIRGHAQRGAGILRNTMYVGSQVRNRQSFTKDPATGRESARLNPRSVWIVTPVTDLRIVPQDLWERAQARLLQMSESAAAQRARANKIWLKRPPRHLLDGLVKCASCGRDLLPARAGRLSCLAGRGQGACQRPVARPLAMLEQAVVEAIASRLASEPIAEAFRDLQARSKLRRARAKARRAALKREHASVARQLGNLIGAIAGGVSARELGQRVDELSRRKATIAARLAENQADLEAPAWSVTPAARRPISELARAFRASGPKGEQKKALMDALRGAIDKITVEDEGERTTLALSGPIVALLTMGSDEEATHDADAGMDVVRLSVGNWHSGSVAD